MAKHQKTELRVRQKKWANEYLASGMRSKKEAAIKAGYSPGSANVRGCNNSKHPKVIAYMEERIKQVEKELGISFEWKLKKLKKIVEICVPEEAEVMEQINHSGALGAIVELNKMQGHYSEEKVTHTTINVDADVELASKILEDAIARHKQEY